MLMLRCAHEVYPYVLENDKSHASPASHQASAANVSSNNRMPGVVGDVKVGRHVSLNISAPYFLGPEPKEKKRGNAFTGAL